MAEVKTQIAKDVETYGNRAQYDTEIKKLLGNVPLLAWVFKTCTEEFAPYSINEIEKCIGDVKVDEVHVHQDESDRSEQTEVPDADKRIDGMNTEDNSRDEGTVRFDVLVYAKTPGGEPVNLIVNVEAQRDATPGYPIEKRAIYYACRLISRQRGTVFTESDYKKIRKVYSIWLCPVVAQVRKNTIKKLSFQEESLYGDAEKRPQDSDLIEIVIANLGDPDDAVESQILRLMNVVLSHKASAKEKLTVMRDEFGIQITKQIEQEVLTVCNLSTGVYADGKAEGRAEGEMKKAKETAINLHEMGMAVDRIAKAVNVKVETVEKWLGLVTA